MLLYADPIFFRSGWAIFFYYTLLPHQLRYGYGHKIRLQDVNNIKLGQHINKNLIVYDQCPSYWNISKISLSSEAPVIFCTQKTLKKWRVL